MPMETGRQLSPLTLPVPAPPSQGLLAPPVATIAIPASTVMQPPSETQGPSPLRARRPSFGACSALVAAAERNDLAGVRAVLAAAAAAGEPPPAGSPCGPMWVTALQLAAAHGDSALTVVQELLQNGAKASAGDKLGRTPLHHAAAAGGVATVRALLAAGADTNARFCVRPAHRGGGSGGDTLPHRGQEEELESVRRGSETSLHFTAGDTLPLPECWGRTPLHLAAKGNFPEIVGLLLKAGATADVTDECGISPLLLAGAGVEPVEAFHPTVLSPGTPTVTSKNALTRYEKVVSLLLEAGADPKRRHPDTGATALHNAARLRSAAAAGSLLAHGADAAAAADGGGGGATPLHEAAAAGALPVIRLLLDKGGDDIVNIPDQGHRTPLHKAAFAGSRSAVALLLERGGDLAARSASDATAADALLDGIPRPAIFLSALFDSCVTANGASVNDRDFKIFLNLKMLCPHGDSEQMGVVRALMEAMPPRVQAVLFQHPLLQTFVRLKWQGLRPFFLLLVAVHVAFVVSLSHYSVELVTHANRWTTKNPFCDSFTDNLILLITAGIVLLYLAGQLLLLPRFYVKEMETWLHFLSAILALGAAVIPHTKLGRGARYPFNDSGNLKCGQEYTRSTNETNITVLEYWKVMKNGSICIPLMNVTATYNDISVLTNCGEPHHSELVLLSLALLLGWSQLMLLAGRFSHIGYYALMFQTVLFNVLKVLASFCFLVVGFALSFGVLFNNIDTFHTWWDSLGRTIVMSTGEMEYTSLFKMPTPPMGNDPLTMDVDDDEYLDFTSRVVFFIFIILAPIVLMNLMVGLAVSDIQSLLEEGLIRMTLKQADFVAHLEALSARISVPRSLRRLCCALLCCGGCAADRRPCRLLNCTVESTLTLQPLFQGPGALRLDDDLLESLAVLALRNRERDRRRRRKAMAFGGVQASHISAQGHQRPLGLALSVPPEGNRRSRSSCGYSSSSSTDSDYTVGSGYNRGGGGGGGGCGEGGRGVAAAVRVRMETEDTSAGECSPPPTDERSAPRRPSELTMVQPPSARAHAEILRQLRRLRREVGGVRAQLWTDDTATPGLLSAPSRRAAVVRRKRTLAEADATAATAAASFRRRRASLVQAGIPSTPPPPPLLRRASTRLSLVAASVRDSAHAMRRFRRLFTSHANADVELLAPTPLATTSAPAAAFSRAARAAAAPHNSLPR